MNFLHIALSLLLLIIYSSACPRVEFKVEKSDNCSWGSAESLEYDFCFIMKKFHVINKCPFFKDFHPKQK